MTNKTTDTIQAVETMIMKRLEILKNGETNELKRKARKEILKLEKHLRDVDDKLINGKKYPERIYHHDDKPMNKTEVLKLIDSVSGQDESSRQTDLEYWNHFINEQDIDLTGVSVGRDRFEFIE